MIPPSLRITRARRQIYVNGVDLANVCLAGQRARVKESVEKANERTGRFYRAFLYGRGDELELRRFLGSLYLFGATSQSKGFYGKIDPPKNRYQLEDWHGQMLEPQSGVRTIFYADNAAHYIGCSEAEFQRIADGLTPIATPIGSAFLVHELNRMKNI